MVLEGVFITLWEASNRNLSQIRFIKIKFIRSYNFKRMDSNGFGPGIQSSDDAKIHIILSLSFVFFCFDFIWISSCHAVLVSPGMQSSTEQLQCKIFSFWIIPVKSPWPGLVWVTCSPEPIIWLSWQDFSCWAGCVLRSGPVRVLGGDNVKLPESHMLRIGKEWWCSGN